MKVFKNVPNFLKQGLNKASKTTETALLNLNEGLTKRNINKKETYDLGVFPVINASILNFLFFGMGLFILSIDKAKHLILSNLGFFDPFVSTVLIFFYCLVCLYIFEKKRYIIEGNLKAEAKKHNHDIKMEPFPKVFGLFNYFILIPLPLISWAIYLIFKLFFSYGFDLDLFPISLISCVGLIFLLIYIGSKFFYKEWKVKSIINGINSEPEEEQSKIAVRFRIIFSFIIILIVHLLIYEHKGRDVADTTAMGEFYENLGYWRFAIQLPLLVLALSYFLKIIKLELKFPKYIDGKWVNIPSYKFIIFGLLLWPLISVGTLRPLDVLVTFIIGVRLIVYGYGNVFNWIFEKGYFIVEKGYPKLKKYIIYFATTVALGVLLLIPLMYAAGSFITQDQFSYEKQEVEKSTEYFSKYATKWLEYNSSKTSPIYLVSGQGGGSRAGCSFYNTMMHLDSTIDGDLLAMTTISGSSNGAGFYLGMKANNLKSNIPKDTILEYSKTLYNKDYITSPLFKMLIVDPIFNVFTNEKRINRNDFLTKTEEEAFLSLPNNPKSIFSKTWKEVYSSKEYFPKLSDSLKLPIFIPVTYNINKAKPAISSPLRFKDSEINGYHQINDTTHNLTLGQSISLSQMFPLISASATVDGDNYMDGGVYDNNASEMLLLLYKITSGLRNDICPDRPIIMLSIQNGEIFNELNSTEIKSEFDAVKSAAIRSIFISNPTSHISKIKRLTAASNDQYFKLDIRDISEEAKEVVMSRYLQKEEIESIHSWSQREIKEVIRSK